MRIDIKHENRWYGDEPKEEYQSLKDFEYFLMETIDVDIGSKIREVKNFIHNVYLFILERDNVRYFTDDNGTIFSSKCPFNLFKKCSSYNKYSLDEENIGEHIEDKRVFIEIKKEYEQYFYYGNNMFSWLNSWWLTIFESKDYFDKEEFEELEKEYKEKSRVRLKNEEEEEKREWEENKLKGLLEQGKEYGVIGSNFFADGKTITLKDGWGYNYIHKFELDDEVKNLIYPSHFQTLSTFSTLREYLLGYNISFKYSYFLNNGTKDILKKSYKVEFKDCKNYIDGVDVPKSRMNFLLERADGTKETINKFKKYSIIQIRLLEYNEFSLRIGLKDSWNNIIRLTLPLSITSEEKNKFKVKLFDVEKELDWKDMSIFKSDLQNIREDFRVKEYEELINLLGIDREKSFGELSKIMILKKLGENDGS